MIEGDGGLPTVVCQVRTYSHYIRAAREAEKKIQLSSPRIPGSKQQMVHPNQGLLASFP